MYRNILVPLENAPADRAILEHIGPLVKLTGAKLLLVHVADGWVARNYDHLKLAESEEMITDRDYLEKVAVELRLKGIQVSTHLALGDPPSEIVKTAEAAKCDLIAMASHGHKLIGDLIFGSTIHGVRHKTAIPVLIVRALKK
jgi:nucleotide-binding universal stress UspA family protein